MKVAVVQFKASTNKEENLKKIISYISKASSKNATLCAFPEFMMFYTKSSQTAKELADLSETINGNFISIYQKQLKKIIFKLLVHFMKRAKKIIVFMILHL